MNENRAAGMLLSIANYEDIHDQLKSIHYVVVINKDIAVVCVTETSIYNV